MTLPCAYHHMLSVSKGGELTIHVFLNFCNILNKCPTSLLCLFGKRPSLPFA